MSQALQKCLETRLVLFPESCQLATRNLLDAYFRRCCDLPEPGVGPVMFSDSDEEGHYEERHFCLQWYGVNILVCEDGTIDMLVSATGCHPISKKYDPSRFEEVIDVVLANLSKK